MGIGRALTFSGQVNRPEKSLFIADLEVTDEGAGTFRVLADGREVYRGAEVGTFRWREYWEQRTAWPDIFAAERAFALGVFESYNRVVGRRIVDGDGGFISGITNGE